MSTQTQYNPNRVLNERLLAAGASKTVYALVTPETENTKRAMVRDLDRFLDMFRGAWTAKQDAMHVEFFDTWHEWSSPVVDLDRETFPFFYPCNGASEAIRHLIYQAGLGEDGAYNRIHIFEGEYEGFVAMAEAAGLSVTVHSRDDWRDGPLMCEEADDRVIAGDLFFISQPSAIDGMVWHDFNEFIAGMPENSVVVDLTYVGAVPASAINERFNLNARAIRNVIFSLSKPFGVYYDRVGGVWCREEDSGLFGNKWFKNLTSLRLGTDLMNAYEVFHIPNRYSEAQVRACAQVTDQLGFDVAPADVFILGIGTPGDAELAAYLRRPRICLTPAMSGMAGTLPQLTDMLEDEL